MSIFDEQKPVNIPLPVMDAQVFWEVLATQNGYRLEQHKLTGHCRILDPGGIRVAWGSRSAMGEELRRLANGPAPLRYGDVIGVRRYGGLYDHYGVYESDDCVYEYAAADNDFGDPYIHTTTLERFIGVSENCFLLRFPPQHKMPYKLEADIRAAAAPSMPLKTRIKRTQIDNADVILSGVFTPELLEAMGLTPAASPAGRRGPSGADTETVSVESEAESLFKALQTMLHADASTPEALLAGLRASLALLPRADGWGDYRLYTAEETIRRARKRLGEAKYNLLTNNCEHYALWCKTGISESYQVKALQEALCGPSVSSDTNS